MKITDEDRMCFLEQERHGVFYNERYNGWRMSVDGGPNDKPWHQSARQAIDAAIRAGERNKI